MEAILNLMTEFENLGDDVSQTLYEQHFNRLMVMILDLIQEKLVNDRDIREIDEFYNLIYSDILRMKNHLRERFYNPRQ